jgi:ComF family protein
MLSLRTLVTAAAHFAGELVGPSGCAACDDHVIGHALFCAACAPTVEPTLFGERGYRSAFEYGGAVATAITRLKYESRADLAPRLGRALLRVARELEGVADVVVPVPLHPRRLADRGYNQAALLASPIARALDLRFAPRALVRSRDTPRQASIEERRARLLNVANAFAVREESLVCGARILLVDDVRTTGATLDHCTSVLIEAGAERVVPLVLARRA